MSEDDELLKEYADEHRLDSVRVAKYEKALWLNNTLGPLLLFGCVAVLALLAYLLPPRIVNSIAFISLSVIVIILSFGIALFFERTYKSYDVYDVDLARHHLAHAIDAYNDSNIDEAVSHLRNAKGKLGRISHPFVAEFLDNIISDMKDDRKEENVERLMSYPLPVLIENDTEVLRLRDEILEKIDEEEEEEGENIQYRDVLYETFNQQISRRQIEIVVILLAISGVLFIFQYIDEQLAILLGALVAILPPVLRGRN